MQNKKHYFFLILLLVQTMLLIGGSKVYGSALFGPNQYLRTTGASNIYNETFSAPTGQAVLVVKNGASDDSDRVAQEDMGTLVSSAIIRLNGVEIFSADDFSKQVYILEFPVILEEINSLYVELRSQPGSYLIIEIMGEVLPPTVSLTADPESLAVGEQATLTWTSTNADYCVIEPSIGQVEASGTLVITPVETTTYSITAYGPGGLATDNASVNVEDPVSPVSVTLIADREVALVGQCDVEAASTYNSSGGTTTMAIVGQEFITLTWSSVNADSCSIEPNIGTVDVNGSLELPINATTTYTITATGPEGSATASTTVYFGYCPYVYLRADRTIIYRGEETTLRWTSYNTDSCFIEPDIGEVPPLGVEEIPLGGFPTVSPLETTTYIITATGFMGYTGQASITITVEDPPLTAAISADPSAITMGESSTLTWSCSNADTCTIEPGIGNVALSGSFVLFPEETTTYTLTASNQTESVSQAVTVTVAPPLPVAELSASQTTIEYGESITLSWTSAHGTDVIIDNGIGEVGPNGSITVAPENTTTYTLTVIGPAGSASDSVTVEVLGGPDPLPEINATANPGSIIQGESAVLSWTSSYANTITISPDIGEVMANGSVTVTPADTTVYTFMVDGPGGSSSCNVTITVAPLSADVTVQGVITDALTGLPLPGAMVSFTDSLQTLSAVSQSDGYYSISGLSTGSADIKVELQGYITIESWTSFSDPGIWVFNFDLLDASSGCSSVQGIILNSKTLMPEEGVTISLENGQGSCITSQDGTYTLDNVPFGNQILHIFKENVQTDSTITIPIGIEPYYLDLAVPYRNTQTTPEQIDINATGLITDGITGLPISGATISVIGTAIEAITDQDGQAALTDLPTGTMLFLVTALNHEAVLAVSEVISGSSDTFFLCPAPLAFGTIAGSVTDAVTSDPVHLCGIDIGEGALAGAQTEPDGAYNMRTVPVGTYTVSASHPAYTKTQETDIVVQEDATVTVDFVLTPKPRTGSLAGIVRDKDSLDPISGAVISDSDTGIVTTSDNDGYYTLDALPAGMVTLLVQAAGYPNAERSYAVDADENDTTPTVTTCDIDLSQTDPLPPETISVQVSALEGGSIETPDKRFQVVIPPYSLSADAIVTIMPPSTGPIVACGDILTLDPQLGDCTVTALEKGFQLAVEPVVQGDPVPMLGSWVVLAGRYSQATINALGLDEQTIFPYYWDGNNWTALQIKPFEAAVDEVNNRHLAVVNFSTTQTGDPVVAELNTKTPVRLASIDDYLPDLGISRLYRFVIAAIGRLIVPPNAYIYDKGELDIIKTLSAQHDPNANGLPLLMVHGWDFWAMFFNQGHTDPNIEIRYQNLVEDLVAAINGVYRPMFGTYNSRSGIVFTGNDLANAYEARGIKGLPGSAPGSTGEFPFIDTFGFSMGGLVSRTFQMHHQGVHNMIMAATPNHGTHFILKKLDDLTMGDLGIIMEFLSPGTADLFPYDDRGWFAWLSNNPTLFTLNRSLNCMPGGDMTLVAGDKGFEDDFLDFLLGPENDKVVPVDSVFCRTSAPDDGDTSLLKVKPGNNITEVTDQFTHLEFSTDKYRISAHDEVYIPIQQGLSDWVVGKSLASNVTMYEDNLTVKFANFEVEAQYNVWHSTYDRLVLVIYAKDINDNWHVASGTYVDGEGSVVAYKSISGNSKNLNPSLTLQTSAEFAEDDQIQQVVCELKSLIPGQTSVPSIPSANFTLPE